MPSNKSRGGHSQDAAASGTKAKSAFSRTSFITKALLKAAPQALKALRPSVSGEKQRHVAAKAIDFLSDGSTRIHYSYDRTKRHGDTPLFQCPPLFDSIRIILFETREVFARSSADADRNENGSHDRVIPICDTCLSLSEASNDENYPSSSHPSLASTGTSHVSQKTESYVSDNSCSFAPEERGGRISYDSDHEYDHDYIVSERNRSRSRISDGRSSSSSSSFTMSSVSDAHSDQTRGWKQHPGASGYDSLKLSQIWSRDVESVRLPVGVNLMFDIDTASGNKDNGIWVKRIHSRERQTLVLKGLLTPFFTVPNCLQSSWQDDKNALEIQMLIFTTLFPHLEGNAEQLSSPLGDELLKILCSESSAMAFFRHDVEMGARLFVFDMLTAIVVCWLTFLNLVYQKSVWGPRVFSGVEPSDNRDTLRDFKISIKDLFRAVDITVEAIEIAEQFDKRQIAKFRDLLRSRRRQREVLRSVMEDVEDSMVTQLDRAERMTRQRQDTSLKRLSLVASIFLPLTTACSMLSMTNRVRDIGVIWWDWLGIVTIIGFVVLVGYSVASGWQKFWRTPGAQRQVQSWRRRWNQAKSEVLAPEIKNRARSRRVEFGRATVPLIPTANRFMFWAARYLFAVAAVASFLVGMFVSVSTGAEALGYSAVGALLTVFAALLIWKIVKLVAVLVKRVVWFVVYKVLCLLSYLSSWLSTKLNKASELRDNHKRERESQGRALENDAGVARTEESRVSGSRENEQTQTRDELSYIMSALSHLLFMVLFHYCVLTPARWIWKAIKWGFKALQWMFAISFGDKILPVLFKMIIIVFCHYVPDEVIELGKTMFGELRPEKTSDATGEGGSEMNEDRGRSYRRNRILSDQEMVTYSGKPPEQDPRNKDETDQEGDREDEDTHEEQVGRTNTGLKDEVREEIDLRTSPARPARVQRRTDRTNPPDMTGYSMAV